VPCSLAGIGGAVISPNTTLTWSVPTRMAGGALRTAQRLGSAVGLSIMVRKPAERSLCFGCAALVGGAIESGKMIIGQCMLFTRTDFVVNL